MTAKSIAEALFESQAQGADTATQRTFSGDRLIVTWLGPESVDPGLSMVRVGDGSTIRGVRKYRSVTGLSAGDQVVLEGIGPDKTATIVGALEGDVTLYVAEE